MQVPANRGIMPLTPQQLGNPKVTRAHIVANALAVFGITIPMKSSTTKAAIVAAYNKAAHNTTVPGGPNAQSQQTPAAKTNSNTSIWTVRCKAGHKGLEFRHPFNRDAHQLTMHMQTALHCASCKSEPPITLLKG